MSALSGITVSPDLASIFADAVQAKTTRFLKVSIQNESLVHDFSVDFASTLEEDLVELQKDDVLPEDSAAYVLAKLDDPAADWLLISYVPDNAKVRDKMLYASTRASLLKALGSSLFTDSIFATSKADLTAEAYASHLRHVAAPNPLSSREQELADLRAAENDTATYEGSRGRASHIGTGVGLNWSKEVEDAVSELGQASSDALVVISIDPQSETLMLISSSETSVNDLGSSLLQDEPCYALFAWTLTPERREIVFVYSCPSNSPIKHRMLYSSGSTTTYNAAKNILASLSPPISIASRKLETSEPKELDETYLKTELGFQDQPVATTGAAKPFAKPKGPPRRR